MILSQFCIVWLEYKSIMMLIKSEQTYTITITITPFSTSIPPSPSPLIFVLSLIPPLVCRTDVSAIPPLLSFSYKDNDFSEESEALKYGLRVYLRELWFSPQDIHSAPQHFTAPGQPGYSVNNGCLSLSLTLSLSLSLSLSVMSCDQNENSSVIVSWRSDKESML